MKNILAFLLVLIYQFAYTQTIHLLLISDTDADGIGVCVNQNHQMMKQRFSQIEVQTGIAVIFHELTGKQVQSNEIIKKISAVKSTNEDVIWFHYSGHGINNGINEWPRFLLDGPNSLSLDKVHEILQQKPHRLLFSMADCCNIGTAVTAKGNEIVSVTSKSLEANEVLKKLLLKSTGDYIVSGSTPGQSAKYLQSSGGIFTISLLDALERCSINGCYTWEYILEETRKTTLETSAIFGAEQKIQIRKGIDSNNSQKEASHDFELYKVKNGDNYFSIARKFILVRKWAQANDKSFEVSVNEFACDIIADNKPLALIMPNHVIKVRKKWKTYTCN